MTRVRKFLGGFAGAVYTCRICGKKTRETGEDESSVKLCASCYGMAGQENTHSDNGHAGDFEYCPICRNALGSLWSDNYKF
jgi:hypothetical protein